MMSVGARLWDVIHGGILTRYYVVSGRGNVRWTHGDDCWSKGNHFCILILLQSYWKWSCDPVCSAVFGVAL